MKNQIIKVLKWALSKFEDKTAQIAAWPFPVEVEKPKTQVKKKLVVKKTTTRKPAAKKPVLKKVK